MKCTQCQNEMRIAPEIVGTDSSGTPIYHRFAYCDNCKIKIDLDMAQNNQSGKKKESVCGIIGMICSFIFCFILFPIVGFILSLIGVCSKKKKSTCGTIGLVVSILAIALNIFALQYMKYVDKAREDSENISTQQNVDNNGNSSFYENDKNTISQDNSEENLPLNTGEVEILAEYTLPDGIGWYTRHFIVVKNNTNETVDVSTSSLAYGKGGELLGADDANFEALGAGCVSILYEAFEINEEIEYYETELNFSKSKYYKSVIQDLSFEQSDIDKGAVFKVTNNGDKSADFVEGYALFFMDGQLVSYDTVYFTDDDSEIKPGKTITKQMTSYEEFNLIEFYLKGRRR